MANRRGPNRLRQDVLSAHGLVVVYLSARPEVTIAELSEAIGLTDRYVAKIVADLRSTGFIEAQRIGARNVYRICEDASFCHPLLKGLPIALITAPLERALRNRLKERAPLRIPERRTSVFTG